LSSLDPSVVVIEGGERGFLAHLEIEDQVFEQPALVAFEDEVVVRLSVLDQVAGQRPLSQERIRTDVLALDIDGV
jgi:hypothetical protein